MPFRLFSVVYKSFNSKTNFLTLLTNLPSKDYNSMVYSLLIIIMYLQFFLAIRYYLRCLGDLLRIDNRRGRPFSQGRTYMHSWLLPLIHNMFTNWIAN